MEVSIAAGEIVGLLYDAFYKQYANPESEHSLKSLNKLCVRLVFCLYAEDAGILGITVCSTTTSRALTRADCARGW